MENTCKELLQHCLRDEDWSPELLNSALELNQGRELLSAVVEPLGDRFDPRLSDTYVRLFNEVIERMLLGQKADEIRGRYRRIRRPGVPPAWTDRVYVLSRESRSAPMWPSPVSCLTLRQAPAIRTPKSCSSVRERIMSYLRRTKESGTSLPRMRVSGTPLAERLRASVCLREKLTGGIVVDPDSRLSQLGLIPVCDEPHYFFFESRSFGGTGTEPLPALAARWARDVFGVSKATPYVAPLPAGEPLPDVTVSFGVGANSDKRVDEAFELELLRMLAETGTSVLVDKGGSADASTSWWTAWFRNATLPMCGLTRAHSLLSRRRSPAAAFMSVTTPRGSTSPRPAASL